MVAEQPVPWQVNQVVLVNYRGGGRWYPAVVSGVSPLTVLYHDASEKIPFYCVVWGALFSDSLCRFVFCFQLVLCLECPSVSLLARGD